MSEGRWRAEAEALAYDVGIVPRMVSWNAWVNKIESRLEQVATEAAREALEQAADLVQADRLTITPGPSVPVTMAQDMYARGVQRLAVAIRALPPAADEEDEALRDDCRCTDPNDNCPIPTHRPLVGLPPAAPASPGAGPVRTAARITREEIEAAVAKGAEGAEERQEQLRESFRLPDHPTILRGAARQKMIAGQVWYGAGGVLTYIEALEAALRAARRGEGGA